MTLLEATVATTSGLTNGEIAGIISATLLGIAAVGGVIVKFVNARRPVELAEVKAQSKREADESLRFKTQHATFETLIEESDARFERERDAHEKTRDRNEGLVRENGRLQEENGQLRFEKLTLTERVDTLEQTVTEQAVEINTLKDEVVGCHADRAADMKGLMGWIMDNFVPRSPVVSEPPPMRPRSITPRETPAVPSASAARETKT
jgi:uncharacterized coiled-coil protein SlyX